MPNNGKNTLLPWQKQIKVKKQLQGVHKIFFSQFQGFQGFFLNFLAVFQGFLVKFLPVFKVLLKNLIRSPLTDSETSERISRSEDSQTQKWVIYRVLILVSIQTNKVKS